MIDVIYVYNVYIHVIYININIEINLPKQTGQTSPVFSLSHAAWYLEVHHPYGFNVNWLGVMSWKHQPSWSWAP